MSRAQLANDRAADWIIRRENGPWSDSDQAELDAWLAEADGNKAAFWRLKHSWGEADRIGALGPATSWSDEETEETAAPSRWWKPLAIAASLALMVGTGSGLYMLGVPQGSEPTQMAEAAPDGAAKFDTPIGGRRVIPLEDGSKVELNTASVVRTSITNDSREVWLDKGEAYFEVAHLEGRPFVVHAGSRTVTVLGTKFSVRRDGDKVTVSVVEGRVRVADSHDATPATIITGGDMAIARGPATLFTAKSEKRVENALSWREGVLSFDQSPLSEVAAEFNRYNRKPIIIRDKAASEIRIGGIFPSSNPDAFVRLLRDAYGLHVDNREDAVIISD
jgi:transmembrane sensor